METEKIYYRDQYARRFTARVVACEPCENHWRVTLDRTAFYPEGGGQPGDRGTLGGAAVTDTRRRGGEIVHICAAPLAPGEEVSGEIDWARRFDFMQQHSGEHIFSGLVHSRFGFDNVGFHLGAETTAIDFSGEVSWDALTELERAANEIVWQDVPVEVSWPDADALARLDYRSKKQLLGAVRIVTVPGADVCACCGTHVARTGEIGLIKIISAQRLRGGTRAELVCGARAYEHVRRVGEQNRKISALLSARPEETAAAAERVLAELEGAQYRLHGCEDRLFRALAHENAGRDAVVFMDGLSSDALRRLAMALAENGGRAAAFSSDGGDEKGFRYALIRPASELGPLVKELNSSLHGRGGGKPPLAQGTVQATRTEIEAFFAAR